MKPGLFWKLMVCSEGRSSRTKLELGNAREVTGNCLESYLDGNGENRFGGKFMVS